MDLWSLRRLGRLTPLRRAVKAAFGLIFRHGRTITIPTGPLRGLRWTVHRDHPFWMPLGQYEVETARWLSRELRPGDVFYDIGARAGYFTLLGSRRVGPKGRVVAFEPAPVNAEVLARQIAANQLENVTLEAVALQDRDEPLDFVVTRNLANAHLAGVEITHAPDNQRSRHTVSGLRLDSYVARGGEPLGAGARRRGRGPGRGAAQAAGGDS